VRYPSIRYYLQRFFSNGRVVRARQDLAASGTGVNRVSGEQLSAEWFGALNVSRSIPRHPRSCAGSFFVRKAGEVAIVVRYARASGIRGTALAFCHDPRRDGTEDRLVARDGYAVTEQSEEEIDPDRGSDTGHSPPHRPGSHGCLVLPPSPRRAAESGSCPPTFLDSESEQLPKPFCLRTAHWDLALLLVVHA
jgi:hypothetical protein